MVVIGETGIIDGNATEKKRLLEVGGNGTKKKKRPLILLTALTPLQRACENGWMDGYFPIQSKRFASHVFTRTLCEEQTGITFAVQSIKTA